jgi:hypothetical protein
MPNEDYRDPRHAGKLNLFWNSAQPNKARFLDIPFRFGNLPRSPFTRGDLLRRIGRVNWPSYLRPASIFHGRGARFPGDNAVLCLV